MKYFIAVLQNGLGFTLILAGLHAVMEKTVGTRRRVMGSLLMGMLGALVFAYLRSLPSLNKLRGNMSFATMSIVFALSFLYFILSSAGLQKRATWARTICSNYLTPLLTAAMFIHYVPTLLLYTQEFMPYGQDTVNTEILLRVLFWFLGLAFLALAAWALYGSAKRLDQENVCFLIRSAFVFNMLMQLALVLQRLYALRLIPRLRWIFALIAFGMNHERLFIFATIAVLAIVPLLLCLRNRQVHESYSNPAELRKIKARMRSARRWAAFMVTMILLAVATLSIVKYLYERETPLSPPEPYDLRDGVAVIPLELLADGHLHRFEYVDPQGRHIRFIAIKKNEGASYGVGFDACEICGASGYYERKDEVVCKLCDVVMNKGTIGFEGGCNPIPLKFTLEEGEMLIQTADLEVESDRFK